MGDSQSIEDEKYGLIARLDIVGSNSSGDATGQVLESLTFAVKDLFAIAGRVTGFGNPDWLKSHQIETKNAKVIDLLLNSGAHLKAVSCSDEMAFSLDGINIHYGSPLNPRFPERICGGSSSGSASMVAGKIVDFALGTDTAGSIRVPASYCNIWGLRPTLAAISDDGVLPLGPTFDTVGIFSQDAATLEKVARTLLSHSFTKEAKQATFKKLLIPDEYFDMLDPALAPDMMARVNQLAEHFASVEKIKSILPQGRNPVSLRQLVQNFNTLRGFEAWRCHGEWLSATSPHLAPAIAQRFMACRNIKEDEANKASKFIEKLRQDVAYSLDDFCVALPTTVNWPPLKAASDEELMSNRLLNMELCATASVCGLPQVNIPGKSATATGLSLMGGPGYDLALMAIVKEKT